MVVKEVSDSQLFVRLDSGENIISKLTEMIKQFDIGSGYIDGIGALKDVTLGYYDITKKEYIKKKFEGEYELISCTGNISLLDKTPFLHLHVLISDSNFNSYGGHLFNSEITITGEFCIIKGNKQIIRKKQRDGLALTSFGENA